MILDWTFNRLDTVGTVKPFHVTSHGEGISQRDTGEWLRNGFASMCAYASVRAEHIASVVPDHNGGFVVGISYEMAVYMPFIFADCLSYHHFVGTVFDYSPFIIRRD